MTPDESVSARMREDWNARAREDAYYYVAFGGREQSDDDFTATASSVAAGIERELRRLPPVSNPRTRRALEIGCGPGRLMKPLARNFGEIHGVDVSDEMVRLARLRLRDISHAHVHATSGATLPLFADESFDLIYSYAVFQHIPSRDVVFSYLREAQRVLKPRGIFCAQFNGLPETSPHYDTWSGVRLSAQDLIGFAREHDFQMLALEGAGTQYMWTTWRKREPGWREQARASSEAARARIRRVTNAHNSEPVVPAGGPFASISVWTECLPEDVDLIDMEALVDGNCARATYIGPPDASGLRQLNAILPPLEATGLLPAELRWFGRLLAGPAILRVIPPGPLAPRLVSVSDGINLMSGLRIETRCVKATFEEIGDPAQIQATVDGEPAQGLEWFCTDPLPRRYEVNFKLPDTVGPGRRELRMNIGRRRFPPVVIEVAK
jgi:SAM-dependent methyltransferase